MTARLIPIFPLKAVLYPNQVLSASVFEEHHKRLLQDCLIRDRLMGVLLTTVGKEKGEIPLRFEVGTIARIDDWHLLGDGTFKVKAAGVERFRIIEYVDNEKPFPAAVVETWDDEPVDGIDTSDLADRLSGVYYDYLSLIVLLSDHSLPITRFRLPNDPAEASFAVAANLEIELTEKQKLLEAPSTVDRLQREFVLVRRERDFLQRLVNLHGVFTGTDSGWYVGPAPADRRA